MKYRVLDITVWDVSITLFLESETGTELQLSFKDDTLFPLQPRYNEFISIMENEKRRCHYIGLNFISNWWERCKVFSS